MSLGLASTDLHLRFSSFDARQASCARVELLGSANLKYRNYRMGESDPPASELATEVGAQAAFLDRKAVKLGLTSKQRCQQKFI